MIRDGTLGAVTLQNAVSFSASGDNTVISGVFGKTFKVLRLILVLGGASNLIFKSGTNAISGTLTMLANGSIVLDYIELPMNGVNTGEAFIINSSQAVTIGGTVWFNQS